MSRCRLRMGKPEATLSRKNSLRSQSTNVWGWIVGFSSLCILSRQMGVKVHWKMFTISITVFIITAAVLMYESSVSSWNLTLTRIKLRLTLLSLVLLVDWQFQTEQHQSPADSLQRCVFQIQTSWIFDLTQNIDTIIQTFFPSVFIDPLIGGMPTKISSSSAFTPSRLLHCNLWSEGKIKIGF